MAKPTVAIVVPAYNEATVISDSLKYLGRVISKKHIFVVSDGSTDQTAALAKQVVPHVLNLRKNRGKAGAIKALIDRYRLTDRYHYIFFFDADTRIGPDFLTKVRARLRQEQPALLVGTVGSGRNSLISAYRVYEYGFSHLFYKNAQNAMGTIAVAPGCASLYRSDVLRQLEFGNHTLTEDFDLTLQIHHRKLGKVSYCHGATVLTQDPGTLGDYWRQVNRWNTGFWQNFFLHRLYQPTKKINLEVLLLVSDILMWLVVLGFAVARPLFLLKLYAFSLLVSSAIGAAVVMIAKDYWALPYVPLFGFFHLINLTSLVYSFFRSALAKTHQLGWQKPDRYALR
jgi:biofilm PGA synthesis N-glycosyltransferase PgaC